MSISCSGATSVYMLDLNFIEVVFLILGMSVRNLDNIPNLGQEFNIELPLRFGCPSYGSSSVVEHLIILLFTFVGAAFFCVRYFGGQLFIVGRFGEP